MKKKLSLLKINQLMFYTFFCLLQKNNKLYKKFLPIVTKSIQSLALTNYWEGLKKNYNKIPLAKKINTDLDDFITRKAIDGLFHLIEKEEQNIRENPSARITDILKRVFN